MYSGSHWTLNCSVLPEVFVWGVFSPSEDACLPSFSGTLSQWMSWSRFVAFWEGLPNAPERPHYSPLRPGRHCLLSSPPI